MLQNEKNDDEKVAQTLLVFESLQIQDHCKAEMSKHYSLAITALRSLPDSISCQELEELAEFLFHRDY